MKQMKSTSNEEYTLFDKINEILEDRKLPENLNISNLEIEKEKVDSIKKNYETFENKNIKVPQSSMVRIPSNNNSMRLNNIDESVNLYNNNDGDKNKMINIIDDSNYSENNININENNNNKRDVCVDNKSRTFSFKKSNTVVAYRDNNSNKSHSSFLKIENLAIRRKSNEKHNKSKKFQYFEPRSNPEENKDDSKQNFCNFSREKITLLPNNNSNSDMILDCNKGKKNKENENEILEIINVKRKCIYLGKFYLDINKKKKYYMVYLNNIDNYENISMMDCTDSTFSENTSIENKIKNKLLSKIAHEFKTPLNNIIGILTTIFIICKDKNLIKELMIVHSLTNYTIFLVNDIILYAEETKFEKIEENNIIVSDDISIISLSNISKINSNYRSSTRKVDISHCLFFCFDILNALLSCNELKKEAVKIELRVDIRLKNLIIYSDELKINQILLNFISNSLKFTKEGSINLIANITEKEGKNYLRISCVDTGFGIPEEEQKELFQENISLDTKHEFNNKGSGTGLSMCRKLAVNLNIILEFCSKENLGSEFSILFPLVKISEPKNINKNRKVIRNMSFVKENSSESSNQKENNIVENNDNFFHNIDNEKEDGSSLKNKSFKRSMSCNDQYKYNILETSSSNYLKGIDELEKNNIPYVLNVKNLQGCNDIKEHKKENSPKENKDSGMPKFEFEKEEKKEFLELDKEKTDSPSVIQKNNDFLGKDILQEMNNLSLRRNKTDIVKKMKKSASLNRNFFNNINKSKNEDDFRKISRYPRYQTNSDFIIGNDDERRPNEEKNNLLKFSNNVYQIYNMSSNEAYHKKSSKFSKFNSSSNFESDRFSYSKISNSCNSISSFVRDSNSLREYEEKKPLSGKYETDLVQMNSARELNYKPNNYKSNFNNEIIEDRESDLISISENLDKLHINKNAVKHNYNDDDNNINFKQKQPYEIKSNNSFSPKSSNIASLNDNRKIVKFSSYPYRGNKVVRVKENPDLIKSVKFNIKDMTVFYEVHKIEDNIGGNTYNIIKEEDSEIQKYDVLKDSKTFSNSFFNSELGFKEEKKDTQSPKSSVNTGRDTSKEYPYGFKNKHLSKEFINSYRGRRREKDSSLYNMNKENKLYNIPLSHSMPILSDCEKNHLKFFLKNNKLGREFCSPREYFTFKSEQLNFSSRRYSEFNSPRSLNSHEEDYYNTPRKTKRRRFSEARKNFNKKQINVRTLEDVQLNKPKS